MAVTNKIEIESETKTRLLWFDDEYVYFLYGRWYDSSKKFMVFLKPQEAKKFIPWFDIACDFRIYKKDKIKTIEVEHEIFYNAIPIELQEGADVEGNTSVTFCYDTFERKKEIREIKPYSDKQEMI